MESKNKKLAKNILLMFLVYFLPKVFSFFLVPIYTVYLTAKEYGVSDLIITTSSLVAPFVALSIPNAVLRFTIENKADNRTIWVALRIYLRGMIAMGIVMVGIRMIIHVNAMYLMFTFVIVATSVLSDINISYARGLERMKLVTICGVGSSFVSITSNIVFIVIMRLGAYGFLMASAMGYIFVIVLTVVWNWNVIWTQPRAREVHTLQKEMLQYSIPTIFSGLSWWVISSSDRYFVSSMCGTAENGIYSIAYKIPTILQAISNVFYQAWMYSLYDSYKTEEGKKYIARVYDVYSFGFGLLGAILITVTQPLAKLLYAKEFYNAWKYAPVLIVSVVIHSTAGLASNLLSIFKETKAAMRVSFIAAATNVVLNYILIRIGHNAMGAAIATAFTFFVSYVLYTCLAQKCSGISIDSTKNLLMFAIISIQAWTIICIKSGVITLIGTVLIVVLNYRNIIWAKGKWKNLLRRS